MASVCPEPGCPILQPCQRHQRQPWQGSTRRARLPSDWSRRVKAVRKRDQDICYLCGGTRCGNHNIEVDHVLPGDDHSLENLACVGATPCHRDKTQREAASARSAKTLRGRR